MTMLNIFLNNRRGGRRRNTGHRRLRDDDDDYEDDDDDYENYPHHHNDNMCHHKPPTMTSNNHTASGGSNRPLTRRGRGDHPQSRMEINSTSSSTSLSLATSTATATTSTAASSLMLPTKMKMKKRQKKKKQETTTMTGRNNEGEMNMTNTTRQTDNNHMDQAQNGGKKIQHIRYLCSLDTADDDDEQEANATDEDTATFPSVGYDDDETNNTSLLSSSWQQQQQPPMHRYYRPTTRTIRSWQSSNNDSSSNNTGLTRLVLSTKQHTRVLSPKREGKRKGLQRDLRPRGRATANNDATCTTDEEEEASKEKQQQHSPPKETMEKKINDNICFYQYTEDDEEFDAAEIIYGSMSLSSTLEEDDNNDENGGGGENAVMGRQFSLFYEKEDEEADDDGMGSGGCIMDLIGVGGRKDANEGSSGETSSQRRMRQQQEQLQNLGRNGWHRALSDMVVDISPPSSIAGIHPPAINTNTKNNWADAPSATLDRLAVTHILQNVQQTKDEYSAIHDEYMHLLKEIECLEKDRVQLELLFYGAVEDAEEERKRNSNGGSLRRSRSNSRHQKRPNPTKENVNNDNGDEYNDDSKLIAYQTFRTSLNRIVRSCRKVDDDILKAPMPVTWLVEDILPLMVTDSYDGGIEQSNIDKKSSNTVSTKNKSKSKRQIFQSFSSSNAEEEPFEDRLRNFRGDGIALLIADQQYRISLVEKCCSQLLPMKKRGYGIGSQSFSSTGSSFSQLSSYAPPVTCSSFVTNVSIDPTAIDMLTLMKLKSGGGEDDQVEVKATFDDEEENDPSAAILIDEGGTYLTHCAITGGWGTTKVPQEERTAVSSYFLKFDNGEIFHGGGVRNSLPSNLVSRLVREGREPATIKYLSTGPLFPMEGGGLGGGGAGAGFNTGNNRCYYAEFDDGECWWGTNNDEILDKIFMDMDVHRVAFGSSSGVVADAAAVDAPCSTTVCKSLSFVVIGKDGSVKWKNVPRGLQNILMLQDSTNTAGAKEVGMEVSTSLRVTSDEDDNDAAAPCEVSLGMDGTYFIRFLDGTVDYVLPSFVADIFDTLEGYGKQIRNVALHVDTYDCLIRYSS